MANFSVPVLRIDAIEEHPNADSLEIAVLRGFRCIVKIGEFASGDIAVYIPEAAVLPDWLLRKLGLWDEEKGKGKLAGAKGNRVKAVRLRGVVSQGLLYTIFLDQHNLPFIDTEDDTDTLYDFEHPDLEVVKSRCIDIDVGPKLGITKYEPPVPMHMAGEVCNIFGHTMKYDIENIQNHPNVLIPGEEVVLTEKLHGCVSPDTKIMLPNGEERTIVDVIYDPTVTSVLSYDIESGMFVPKKITGKSRRPNSKSKRWFLLHLENGRKLKITEDHPVFSIDRNMYVMVKDLHPEEDIKSPI